MSVRIKADGDTITINQSAIASYVRCNRSFQLGAGVQPGGDIFGAETRLEGDASTCGTVFHSVVEHEMTEGRFPTLGKAQAWGKTEMTRLLTSYEVEGIPYVRASFGNNPDAIYSKLAKLIAFWYNSNERKYWLNLKQHHPELIHNEFEFDIPFMERKHGRYKHIRLAGTIDVLDQHNHQLVDWKSSGQYKQPWQEQRWAIQATAYTFAAASLGMLDPHDDGYHFGLRVFVHKGNDVEPQTILVRRGPDHWAWLVEIVEQLVSQIESDLKTWAFNDTHALCSPKWCPSWSECKGRYIGDDF